MISKSHDGYQWSRNCFLFLSTWIQHVFFVAFFQSYVFCVIFCRALFVFLSLSFGNVLSVPSLIYGFWLPLWYLHTDLIYIMIHSFVSYIKAYTFSLKYSCDVTSTNTRGVDIMVVDIVSHYKLSSLALIKLDFDCSV